MNATFLTVIIVFVVAVIAGVAFLFLELFRERNQTEEQRCLTQQRRCEIREMRAAYKRQELLESMNPFDPIGRLPWGLSSNVDNTSNESRKESDPQ